MKITELKCTACNGTLNIDENNPHVAVCEYCNTRYVIEDVGNNNIRLGQEVGTNWYQPQKPAAPKKKTGWEPYGWKRGTAVTIAGILAVLALNWKGISKIFQQENNHKVVSALKEDKTIETTAEVIKETPFTGMFAAMAETVLYKPAADITEQELAKFQWVEMRYSGEYIKLGYSFSNPYEDSEAELTWITLPRDDAEGGEQIARFKGLKKLCIAGYVSPDTISGLPLEGITCYARTIDDVIALIESTDTIKDVQIEAGLESLAGIGQVSGLERFSFSSYDITDIKELVNLKSLKSLEIDCDTITDFSVLSVMTGLTELSIESEAVRDIGFIDSLPELVTFKLTDAEVLHLNSLAGKTNLTSVKIEDCDELKDMSAISSLTGLKELNIEVPYNCTEPDLSPLTELQSLTISGFDSTQFLAGMSQLETLILKYSKIKDVSVFTGLSNLKKLDCSNMKSIEDWSFVSRIPALEVLNLNGVSTYENISGIFSGPALRELYLNGAECEIRFDQISPNENLEILEMDGVNLYTNVNISGGGGIIYVDYDKVALAEHMDFLSKFPGLKTLSLAENTLTDLSFAAQLPALENLDISGNYITDLNPLESLSSLQSVTCTGNPINNYRVLNEKVAIIQ